MIFVEKQNSHLSVIWTENAVNPHADSSFVDGLAVMAAGIPASQALKVGNTTDASAGDLEQAGEV
jgi:molybdopterin biosynthesis enzyme